ncbi:MAG: acyl-CoA thioesterase [Rhodobacteraceae bacterium]|nr:acyl-CoA thioesterase [Paracoccaceae bacterium]
MARERSSRADYAQFKQMTTRWRDNDMYGHMNNGVFYEYVDTAVNMWLIENAALDIPHGEVVGLVVETSCTFHGPLGFPEPLDVGLKVSRIGNTSVTFEIGLFDLKDQHAAAEARFTHVYVNAKTRRPVPVSEGLRVSLGQLLVS